MWSQNNKNLFTYWGKQDQDIQIEELDKMSDTANYCNDINIDDEVDMDTEVDWEMAIADNQNSINYSEQSIFNNIGNYANSSNIKDCQMQDKESSGNNKKSEYWDLQSTTV